MPLDISSSLKAEMNRLETPYSVHELVEIELSSASTSLYYAIGNQDVSWNGKTWTAWAIQPGQVDESGEGDLPTLSIDLSNVARVIQTYIENASAGLIGENVVIRAVHSEYTSVAYYTLNYQIQDIRCTPQWVTFKLGSENFYYRQFPRHVMRRNICRYDTFKSTDLCKYAGGETSCDRTLERCIALSNTSNFGGLPGIPGGGWETS